MTRSQGLSKSRFIVLTTFRQNGAAVATPVCFAIEEKRAWVLTRSDSGKVRRLKNNSTVTVATSDAKGTALGPILTGVGYAVGVTNATAERLLAQKYGFFWKGWRLLDSAIRLVGRGHEWTYLQIDIHADKRFG